MDDWVDLRFYPYKPTPWLDFVAFHLFASGQDQKTYEAEVLFHEVPEGSEFGAPLFRLDMAKTQALMDRLWDIGFRPTEGTGSAGALAATQKHLHDLQGYTTSLLAFVLKERFDRP